MTVSIIETVPSLDQTLVNDTEPETRCCKYFNELTFLSSREDA